MRQTELTKIKQNALKLCSNLRIIDFSFNRLTSLNERTFEGTTKLEIIYMKYNSIDLIDGKVFQHLKNLKVLVLEGNIISKFLIYSFPVMPILHEIDIRSNKLLDLNEIEIVAKFSGLQKIYTKGNLISCKRKKQIINFFYLKNIQTDDSDEDTLDCIVSKEHLELLMEIYPSCAKCLDEEELTNGQLIDDSSNLIKSIIPDLKQNLEYFKKLFTISITINITVLTYYIIWYFFLKNQQDN